MLVRFLTSLVLFPIVNAVVFGAFLVLILSVPAMSASAEHFLWAALKASLLVAAPLAWECAPALLPK
jgi:hypothetical protein